MSNFKPMKACDVPLNPDGSIVAGSVKYPAVAMPKIDGVYITSRDKKCLGRSLKAPKNKFLNKELSYGHLNGLIGELCVGEITDSDLCRKTTSHVNRIEGEFEYKWVIFDYFVEGMENTPFIERLEEAFNRLLYLGYAAKNIQRVEALIVNSDVELEAVDNVWLDLGYEGTIVRAADGVFKFGRATKTTGDFYRLKRFIEEEAVVIDVVEGQQNNNEAKKNELGHTERSSHKENMVPNGMVGSLTCIEVKTGKLITVGAGALTHDERKHYFENQSEIKGKVIKYKHFPKGVKDKPRFPQYASLRAESDIDEEMKCKILLIKSCLGQMAVITRSGTGDFDYVATVLASIDQWKKH